MLINSVNLSNLPESYHLRKFIIPLPVYLSAWRGASSPHPTWPSPCTALTALPVTCPSSPCLHLFTCNTHLLLPALSFLFVVSLPSLLTFPLYLHSSTWPSCSTLLSVAVPPIPSHLCSFYLPFTSSFILSRVLLFFCFALCSCFRLLSLLTPIHFRLLLLFLLSPLHLYPFSPLFYLYFALYLPAH